MPFQSITSAQNSRLKRAAKLRSRRSRDQQGRMLIDGRREIALARATGVEIEEIFVDSDRLADSDLLAWLEVRAADGTEVLTVANDLISRISYGGRDDQCVAIALQPERALADVQLPSVPLVAVLERVEKPGNLGAIVRTADAAGIDAVIVADLATDLFNPNAVRASRGTIFTMQIGVAQIRQVVDWLSERQLQVAVARPDAERSYDQIDFCGASAIVLGNEAEGVSSVWKSDRFLGLQIPMLGNADSLNVAAAAAVLFYEARRQRDTAAHRANVAPRHVDRR